MQFTGIFSCFVETIVGSNSDRPDYCRISFFEQEGQEYLHLVYILFLQNSCFEYFGLHQHSFRSQVDKFVHRLQSHLVVYLNILQTTKKVTKMRHALANCPIERMLSGCIL